jgi:nitroimidazol reductase NimA-like FMN-containing flavoprotein (pyridoxamine 5'-phosphate oxidase superfamily)
MIGELNATEIREVLAQQHLGRLGVWGEGRVYIFPVSYGFDGGDVVYIQSHEGLKVRLMRAHAEVCFEVERLDGPCQWETVMVHGTFEEIHGEAQRDEAFAIIAGQGGLRAPDSIAPYLDGPGAIVVCRIHIAEATGRFERDDPLILARGG